MSCMKILMFFLSFFYICDILNQDNKKRVFQMEGKGETEGTEIKG